MKVNWIKPIRTEARFEADGLEYHVAELADGQGFAWIAIDYHGGSEDGTADTEADTEAEAHTRAKAALDLFRKELP